jgi:DnaJ-domain-containing protein 1
MGQIFNRFKKYVKSEINSDDDIRKAEKMIGSEDDELRRIIEELNEVKKEEKKREESQTREDTSTMNAGIAYSILDIPQNATIEQIKAAYRVKLKEYHPDKVAHLGEELKQLAAKKTLQINNAYDYIKKLKDF